MFIPYETDNGLSIDMLCLYSLSENWRIGGNIGINIGINKYSASVSAREREGYINADFDFTSVLIDAVLEYAYRIRKVEPYVR